MRARRPKPRRMRNAVSPTAPIGSSRVCSRRGSARARPKAATAASARRISGACSARSRSTSSSAWASRQHHQLLDLGCGTLRGGLPLIGYLSAGNYTGIDVRAEIIEEALRELEEAGLEQRYPRISHVDSLAGLDLRALVRLHLGVQRAHAPRGSRPRGRARVRGAPSARERGCFYANVHLGDGRLGTWAGFPVLARPLDWYRDARARGGALAPTRSAGCASSATSRATATAIRSSCSASEARVNCPPIRSNRTEADGRFGCRSAWNSNVL